MTDSPQSTPIWRVPQQARSWERFHRILDAAAELFTEIGYESVTTDEIAARANTSVGGLYRFFPDKLAVFHALLDRYLTQLRELSAALHTEEAMQVTLDVYVNQLVDAFDQFVSANPGFRTVFVQSRLIPTTIAMSAAFYQELAQQFTVYFAVRNPTLEPSHRELIATISVEVACTLDILAVSRDSTFQHQVLIETKKLLIAYLGQYFPDRS
ncbi:TetR/AcrR family transcriptional regulator [Leptolyngbya sp. NIES-2104]|uniref:TetR/AcrR family transcriptional regulator n=1 Tax=Leptolyngbya sp. NIES-2104 TaxID=1552121 RepID=UPI0006EC5A9B|nr:TetR/AcrR family transcriptional regulator [Leptolyngbya sp. NIES-2104]GAP99986.1 transcriptional regulator, TetR family [Leptolyngbya sp. NIES-2104]